VRWCRPSVEGAVALELEPVAAISFIGGDCARAAMVDGEEGVMAVVVKTVAASRHCLRTLYRSELGLSVGRVTMGNLVPRAASTPTSLYCAM
jgi:hypothetical protein